MKTRKKIENDIRTELYVLYAVCLLFLMGTLFRNQKNSIPIRMKLK